MAEPTELKKNLWWIRDARNPVLPPVAGSATDCGCCMNPWVLRLGEEYHLYYAGADAEGRRRICKAVAPVADLSRWTRHGPLLEPGREGEFDHAWTVLPHVVEIAPGRWRLYYTGNCGVGPGLSAFPGIGVALSDDGLAWRKYEGNPILARTKKEGDPDAQGIAGGSVLKVRLPDGGTEWRYYYTGCPTLGSDLFRNQQKNCCLAVSSDGLQWEKRGAVMFREPDRDYEDVAVAGPVVRQEEDGSFRMWFSAIGTRWGAYSIGYAESADGLVWRRGGHYGDDLQLSPTGDGWERRMVEYPTVIREGNRLRLFYCGNGYGSSGIGTAVSTPLRAMAEKGHCSLRIVAAETADAWHYRVPEAVHCDEGNFTTHVAPLVDWHGPAADGALWHEWRTNDGDFQQLTAKHEKDGLGLVILQGIEYRVIATPVEDGLNLIFTIKNICDRPFHNVAANPCLGRMTGAFLDPGLERTFIVTRSGLTPLKDTDRGTGNPIRTHYRVRGQRPLKFYAPSYWGEAGATEAETGAVLRVSADGRWTVGTVWEGACEIFQNGDSNSCIHSVPSVGDLQPGETRTVTGRIVFVEGGPEAALKALTVPGCSGPAGPR